MHPALQRRRRHLMMTRRTVRRGSQRRGLATFLLVALGVFGLTFVGSVMGTAGGMFAAYTYYATGLPDPNILDDFEPAESTYVYDRTGQTLLARFECQNREAVKFGELPDVVWQATVASEDRTLLGQQRGRHPGDRPRRARQPRGRRDRPGRLDDHPAGHRLRARPAGRGRVDPGGPGRQPGRQRRGGGPGRAGHRGERSRGAGRRLQAAGAEPSRATSRTRSARTSWRCRSPRHIPGREGKEKILETYLNLIYYGNGSYGIRAAAANYFGITDLAELTICQAAFLAGLPQRPSFLRPLPEPER